MPTAQVFQTTLQNEYYPHLTSFYVPLYDFKLVNLCTRDDIVVTQDYGVAAMALSKGAYAINRFLNQLTAYTIS